MRLSVAVAVLSLSATAFAQKHEKAAEDARPTGMTVGIGAGYSFPGNLLQPNTASVRFRVMDNITVEPMLDIGAGAGDVGRTTTFNNGTTTTTNENKDTTGGFGLGLGAAVRYAMASAGPVDFLVIGGLGFGYSSNTQNNDVTQQDITDKSTTSGLGVGLNWGLGVEWFITRNIALSADATNPLLSWNRTTVTDEVVDNTGATAQTSRDERVTSAFTGGLTFNPDVRLMFHLYF